MVYTAARSVHLVQTTLPPGSEIMGYAALFGLDFALIAWVVFKMFGARGDKQHAISTFMIVLQVVGVGACLLADTWTVADPGHSPEVIGLIALWVVPGVITINVGAVTAVHLSDPTHEIRNAQNTLEDELNKQVAEYLRQNRGQIAGSVTPQAAQHRASELLAQFVASQQQEQPDGALEGIRARLSGNGHGGPSGRVLAADGSEPVGVGRKRKPKN